MAKIKAHGYEIGTLEYTDYNKRYMSDGVVLINRGSGWKIHGKVKEGHNIRDVYEKALAKQIQAKVQFPCSFEYRKQLHDLAPISKRWVLHSAVKANPQDPDGVWSDVCDGVWNVHADIDEIVMLCRFYLLAVKELKQAEEQNKVENTKIMLD